MTALSADTIRRALSKLKAQPMPHDFAETGLWYCAHCDQVTLIRNMPCCEVTGKHFDEALSGAAN